MAMIRAKPIRSVGANTVPSTSALVTVAETGSTVPMRLARTLPISLTPCMYRLYARKDPTTMRMASAIKPDASNAGTFSHGRTNTEITRPETNIADPVTMDEP